jgi:hypothetical protein
MNDTVLEHLWLSTTQVCTHVVNEGVRLAMTGFA